MLQCLLFCEEFPGCPFPGMKFLHEFPIHNYNLLLGEWCGGQVEESLVIEQVIVVRNTVLGWESGRLQRGCSTEGGYSAVLVMWRGVCCV